MGHDHSDPDQPPIREGAECDPARVDVMLEGRAAAPRRSARRNRAGPRQLSSSFGPLVKFDSVLLVYEVDPLLAVDLGDAAQFFASRSRKEFGVDRGADRLVVDLRARAPVLW